MFGVFGKPVIRAYPSSRKSSKHNNGFRTDHQYSIKEQDGYDGDKKQEYRRRHQIVNRSRFRQLVSLKSKFYHGSMLRCAVCFGSLFFICVHMSHHISTKQQLTSGRECATKRLSHKSQNGIANDELMRLFSTKHPRTLQYDNLYSSQPERVLYIPIVKRSITDWTKEDQNRQKDLWNDEEYDPDYVQAFSGYEDQPQCKPMHEWQKLQFPTCNSVHEQALNDEEAWKFLANGWYRQTFEVNDPWSKDPFAMKTLRNIRDFYPNLLDRHRVDALIYERTTSSPWITDIYSYCSYSGLFEYANGGTLMDEILQKDSAPPLSRRKKLKYAIQAASGMADLHSIDSINGYAAMPHTDIMFDQWIWTGDRYKLNDFNRGHLLYWDETKRKSCQYRWNENNPGCVSK